MYNYEDPSKKLAKSYQYEESAAYSVLPKYSSRITVLTTYTGPQCNFINPSDSRSISIIPNASSQACTFDTYTAISPISFSDISSISAKNYTKVTELQGLNGELGKIEYIYPSISYNSTNYPEIPINKNPLDGKLKKKIIYQNKAGVFKKVSEETYTYDYTLPQGSNIGQDQQTPESVSDGSVYSYKYTTSNGIKKSLSFNTPFPNFYAKGYILKTSHLNSITTTTTVYDLNDETRSVTTNSTHKFDMYGLLKESIINNNAMSGLSSYSRIYRMYELPGANPDSYYITYKPYEVITYKYMGDFFTGNIVKRSYESEFDTYGFGGNLTGKYISNSSVIPATSLTSFDPSYKKVLSNTFSTYGNLLQQDLLLKENTSGGYTSTFLTNSTLFGYTDKLPIANISNANKSQVFYNGYEFSSAPSPTSLVDIKAQGTDAATVFTGRYAIKLNASPVNGSSYAQLGNILPSPQTGQYKFSCWIKTGGSIGQNKAYALLQTAQSSTVGSPKFPNVTEASNIKYIDYTKQDWQYVEVMLDLEKVKVSASGTSLYLVFGVFNLDTNYPLYIDDVRLHPADAQMTTCTYKTGFGKTSESGPDNKPILYEYDSFGRLLYVKDFRKNILKKNQYFTK